MPHGDRFRFYLAPDMRRALEVRDMATTSGVNTLIARYARMTYTLTPELPMAEWNRVFAALTQIKTRAFDPPGSMQSLRHFLDGEIEQGFTDRFTDGQLIAMLDAVDRLRALPENERIINAVIPKEKITP